MHVYISLRMSFRRFFLVPLKYATSFCLATFRCRLRRVLACSNVVTCLYVQKTSSEVTRKEKVFNCGCFTEKTAHTRENMSDFQPIQNKRSKKMAKLLLRRYGLFSGHGLPITGVSRQFFTRRRCQPHAQPPPPPPPRGKVIRI